MLLAFTASSPLCCVTGLLWRNAAGETGLICVSVSVQMSRSQYLWHVFVAWCVSCKFLNVLTVLFSVHRGFGKQGFQCQGKSTAHSQILHYIWLWECGRMFCLKECVLHHCRRVHCLNDLLALCLMLCWCWQAGVKLKVGACQRC